MLSPLKHILTHSYKDGMVLFLNSHPESFPEAIQLAITNDQPYSWRAAWLLWSCLDQYGERCKIHINEIIESIPSKQDGHQRELLKILFELPLSEDQEGIVYNLCVNLWESIDKKPSIRYTAFRFMIKIAQKHHDLMREIHFLTEKHYLESLSPGVKKGIHKLLQSYGFIQFNK
ncbi:MAG: hypothetical protein KA264_06530 [Crocinitomicaceae bacterium]|nr:hypothetical protein [Crocinitomicaceae bacterium]